MKMEKLAVAALFALASQCLHGDNTSAILPVSLLDTEDLTFETFENYSEYEYENRKPCGAEESADVADSYVLRSPEHDNARLSVRVAGAGTLTFKCKQPKPLQSDSEYGGLFTMYKDGEWQSGTGWYYDEWIDYSVVFYSDGDHCLEWYKYGDGVVYLGDFEWTPAPESMIVAFFPNGGEVGESFRVYSLGDTYDLDGENPLPIPSRDGFEFLGWRVGDADGVSAIEPSYVLLVDFSFLVAKWGKPVSTMAVAGIAGFSAEGESPWHAVDYGEGFIAETEIEGVAATNEYGRISMEPDVSTLYIDTATAGYLTVDLSFVFGNLPEAKLGEGETFYGRGDQYVEVALMLDGKMFDFFARYPDDVFGHFGMPKTVKVTVPEGKHRIEIVASGHSDYVEIARWNSVSGSREYRIVKGGAPALRAGNISFESAGPQPDLASWWRKVRTYGSWTVGDLARFADEYQARINSNVSDYEARILHAAMLLANLGESSTFKSYAARFGFAVNYFGLSFDGEMSGTANWPEVNGMVDSFVEEAVPVMKDALADLEAIPSTWAGSVVLRSDDYPLDEDTAVDVGDVLYARAAIEAAIGCAYFLKGYDLSLDWAKGKAAVESSADSKVSKAMKLLKEQTKFLSRVRSQTSLAASKTWMASALATALSADGAVSARTDDAMHFVEYDPVDGDAIAKARSLTQKALASFEASQTVDVQEDVIDDVATDFDATLLPNNGVIDVYLGALFTGRIVRDLLPSMESGNDGRTLKPVGTIPDAMVGGLLPQMSASQWIETLDNFGIAHALRIAAGLIPSVDVDASAAAVTNAIDEAGFADAVGVKAAIGGSAKEYAAFKEWAGSVKSAGSASGASGAVAGDAAVVANTNAAAAYLLGAERLFENAPNIEFGEVVVGGKGTQGTEGTAVTVGVVVKDGEDAVNCAAEKVKTLFEATGDVGDWDGAAKLTPTVTVSGTDANGKMTFVVTPGGGTAKKAFLRIRR